MLPASTISTNWSESFYSLYFCRLHFVFVSHLISSTKAKRFFDRYVFHLFFSHQKSIYKIDDGIKQICRRFQSFKFAVTSSFSEPKRDVSVSSHLWAAERNIFLSEMTNHFAGFKCVTVLKITSSNAISSLDLGAMRLLISWFHIGCCRNRWFSTCFPVH